MEIDIKKIANMIDNTILAPNATLSQIEKLCNESKEYGFFSVCVNPYYILPAKKFLAGSNVLVCTVIGFPLGQNTLETKVFETKDCVAKGAQEIDMVINIPKLKEGDIDFCVNEINEIKKACNGATLKVIVETCLLTPQEKELAAKIVLKSNAEFIKTSTGFSTAGATFEDMEIFKSVVQNNKLIKAAGGIKNTDDLLKMISLGANRIGTSRGVELIEALKKK